jgi:xanthine dehydrogenase YagR molybdenum-binding subunit
LSFVSVELGDSNLPPAPVAGGSNTTAIACSAVMKACEAIRSKLSASAPTSNTRSPGDSSTVGSNTSARPLNLQESFSRLGVGAIEEYAEYLPRAANPIPSRICTLARHF